MSDNTLLLRAQVAVERGACADITAGNEHPNQSTNEDELIAQKCGEFSARIPKDKKKVYITVVLSFADKVVISDLSNHTLKLFDEAGTFLSSVDSKDDIWGITLVDAYKHTFATCGLSKKVHFWSLNGKSISGKWKSYNLDHRADGIHFNDKYYSLVHIEIDTITLLDIKGKLVTKITMKRIFGRVIKFSWDIHMDDTDNNIVVSCQDGVLCLSIKGEVLWFKALSYGRPKGITEINNMFYVADMFQRCVLVLSRTGEIKKPILAEEELRDQPDYLSFNHFSRKLFISFFTEDKIAIYLLNRV